MISNETSRTTGSVIESNVVLKDCSSSDVNIGMNNNQNNILASLKTEVLELKEILADYYAKKDDLKNYMSINASNSFELKSHANATFLTRVDADAKFNSLTKSISNLIGYDDLKLYMKKSDYTNIFRSMNGSINELKDELNDIKINKIDSYTKKEIDDKHFLTEQQSLKGYATEKWVEEWVKEQGYLTRHLSLEPYVKMDWILKQNFLTEHQPLDEYAKKDWIDEQKFLTRHQSLVDYARKDWVLNQHFLTEHQSLEDYAKKDNIPSKLSELENDMNFLTKHQSLSAYVKKEEIRDFITASYVDDAISNININIDDIDLVSKDDLVNFIDKCYADRTYAKKSAIPSLDSYLMKDEASQIYLKRSEIPSHEKFALIDDINDNYVDKVELDAKLTYYAKADDVNKLKNDIISRTTIDKIYSRKSEVENALTSYVTKDMLSNYVRADRMYEYLNINISDELNADDLKEILKSFALKSEFNSYALKSDLFNYVKSYEIENFIKSDALKPYAKLSDIANDYVKKDEISEFITEKNENIDTYKFALKSDLTDYVNKSEILDFVKSYEIENFIKTDVLKSYAKLSDIPSVNDYIKEDDAKELIDKKINKAIVNLNTDNSINLTDYVKKDVLSLYAKKSDVQNHVDLKMLSKYIEKNEIGEYIPSLDDFVDRSELTKSVELLKEYVNKKVRETLVVDDFVRHNQLLTLLDNYVTEERLDLYVKEHDMEPIIDKHIIQKVRDVILKDNPDFLLRNEAYCEFLKVEDYRGIRNASTLNTEFKDNPNKFFNIVKNNKDIGENIDLHDGFYIVGGEVMMVSGTDVYKIGDKQEI